jgi:hypothetical protein
MMLADGTQDFKHEVSVRVRAVSVEIERGVRLLQ